MGDFGKKGSKESASYFHEQEAGVPHTGFDEAPRGEFQKFEKPGGHHGTNPGAH